MPVAYSAVLKAAGIVPQVSSQCWVQPNVRVALAVLVPSSIPASDNLHSTLAGVEIFFPESAAPRYCGVERRASTIHDTFDY
jgi:hypothetical protein